MQTATEAMRGLVNKASEPATNYYQLAKNASGSPLSTGDSVMAYTPRVDAERISRVISKLEGVAELLPGLIRAANAMPPGLAHYARRDSVPDTIEEAIAMLQEYHGSIREKEEEAKRESLSNVWKDGHSSGVAFEAKRAKEARRGRKH